MAIQYLQKKHAGTDGTPTAILDDSTGKAIILNRSKAAGLAYDDSSNELKFNGADAIKTLVDKTTAQTLTNKTLTSPVLTTPTITGAVGAAPTEVVIATNIITAAESGTTFFLNAAVEFVSTLPAPAAGLRFKFVVTGAPAGASYTIVGASGTPIHGFVLSKDLNAGTDGGATAGTGVLTITLVDGKAQKGDTVLIESDGTDWYAICMTGGTFDAITLS